MRFFKIANGFNRMADSYLLVRGRVIHQSMGASSDFPNPTPTLNELKGTLDLFETAIQNAESGNRQDVATKNQLRETLITQLHLLGNFVLYKSGNNEVIATSSGFRITKAAEPRPPITTPQGILLKSGLNKGELELSCQQVTGASAYVHEITKSPVTGESKWTALTLTLTKNVFAGLQSGQEYAARIAAVGPKKQLAYSDVVTRIAL